MQCTLHNYAIPPVPAGGGFFIAALVFARSMALLAAVATPNVSRQSITKTSRRDGVSEGIYQIAV